MKIQCARCGGTIDSPDETNAAYAYGPDFIVIEAREQISVVVLDADKNEVKQPVDSVDDAIVNYPDRLRIEVAKGPVAVQKTAILHQWCVHDGDTLIWGFRRFITNP